MRRTLAWLAALAGVAGLARSLRRRPPAVPEPAYDPRADELRRRLEEAAPLAEEAAAEPEPAVDEAPDPPPARTREDVHARARAAIREMEASGAGEGGDAVGEPPGDA